MKGTGENKKQSYTLYIAMPLRSFSSCRGTKSHEMRHQIGPPVCIFFASRTTGRVRAACTPRWQPCVRAQATLHKKKHYLPVMKATNSDSKRCQVSVDVSFQSPSCFQRKKAHTFSSQAKGGRPHRHITSHIQPNAQVLIPAKFLDHRVPGVSWTTRTLMSSAGPSQNAGQPTIRR